MAKGRRPREVMRKSTVKKPRCLDLIRRARVFVEHQRELNEMSFVSIIFKAAMRFGIQTSYWTRFPDLVISEGDAARSFGCSGRDWS